MTAPGSRRWLTLTPARGVAAVALCWLAFALPRLGDYGVTSDSPSLFYAGDRHLFWMLHPGVPGALDLLSHQEPPGFRSNFFRFPEFEDPAHYPVLPGWVAAVSAAVTAPGIWPGVGLGPGLGPIDGHHLGLVLLQAAALSVFTAYAIAVFGLGAGVSAGLALAFFPCVAGHAFNNAKDLPCAMFYGAALLAAARGVLEDRPRALLACGALVGLGLSCKINAVFALVCAAGWTPLAYVCCRRRARDWRGGAALLAASYLPPLAIALHLRAIGPQLSWVAAAAALTLLPTAADLLRSRSGLRPATLLAGLAAPALALALFVALWPWLWAGQSLTFAERLHFYVGDMFAFSRSDRPDWTSYPLRALWGMTPLGTLGCAALGLAALLGSGRAGQARAALLAVWVGVPILRIAMPHSMFYDANRHFLEYLPGLAMAAGVGFAALLRVLERTAWLGGRPRIRAAALALATTAGLASLLGPIAAYHPYEVAYFNPLVGGLGGAETSAFFRQYHEDWRTSGTEGDYWHTSSREFLRRANDLVPAGATLSSCGTSPEQLLANAEGQPLSLVRQPVDADYIYLAPREAFCGWRLAHYLERRRPVLLRVTRGGGLIYEILGPPSDFPLATVSPRTAYDPPGGLPGFAD